RQLLVVQMPGEIVCADVVQQGERVVDRTEPAQGVERCQRAQRVRLRRAVAVDAVGSIEGDAALALLLEAGLRLCPVRMGLQLQRLRRGHELQQVRQICGDRLERRSVVQCRRCERVRAHPPLRPRSAVGRFADHLRNRRGVSPRVVLRPSVDPEHASTRYRSQGLPFRRPTLRGGCVMQHKILLTEDQIPTQWYNIIPDLPSPPPPPLHPGTMQPVGPDDLAPLFPVALIMQEVTSDSYVDIPGGVLDVYKLWRPSPLFRAHRLEKALDTPARIYYKYEGVSPAGSHKPNTAVPQAYYNHQEGITKLTHAAHAW